MPRPAAPALLAVALALTGTGRVVGADAPVVVLPKVVVSETSLQEREHWRYTQVAGFEILSQAGDATLAQLVQKLQAMSVVVKSIWPAPVAATRAPTSILLCSSDRAFSGFIPSRVSVAIDPRWVDRLFLKDEAQEVIILNCDRTGDAGRFQDIVRDYARRCLLALRQPPPDWFVTGMAEVIADAVYGAADGQLKIHYAALDKVTLHAPEQAFALSAYETERPDPAVREVIRGALDSRARDDAVTIDGDDIVHTAAATRFNSYFAQNLYHPDFADVLRNNPAVHPDDYRMSCWAFVHLCAFAQQRGYGNPLRQLLRAAGRNPGGDMVAMFHDAFGVSPRSMGATISEYAKTSSSSGVFKTIPFQVDPPVITDADPAQIGRLKSDAYRLGGHPAEAAAELARSQRR